MIIRFISAELLLAIFTASANAGVRFDFAPLFLIYELNIDSTEFLSVNPVIPLVPYSEYVITAALSSLIIPFTIFEQILSL